MSVLTPTTGSSVSGIERRISARCGDRLARRTVPLFAALIQGTTQGSAGQLAIFLKSFMDLNIFVTGLKVAATHAWRPPWVASGAVTAATLAPNAPR